MLLVPPGQVILSAVPDGERNERNDQCDTGLHVHECNECNGVPADVCNAVAATARAAVSAHAAPYYAVLDRMG